VVMRKKNITGISFNLDMSGQAPGMYLIIIRTADNNKVIETGRIIIQDE